MTSISAKELRLDLKKIVARLEHGESFQIIYRSRPIADLIPKKRKLSPEAWISQFHKLQNSSALNKRRIKIDAVKEVRKLRNE